MEINERQQTRGAVGNRPGSAIVTPQRQDVLNLLAEYHYLRTSDIYALLGVRAGFVTRERAVRRVLMLMHRAGLVYRKPYVTSSVGDRFLRYEHCYSISRRGARALGQGRVTPEKSPLSIVHEVEISCFHRALAETVSATTFALRWWQTDLKRTVNPDALFAVTDRTKPRESSTRYYFLEIEKSRQGHYRNGESALVTKLRRYADYRRTERCRADWQYFADFRVAVVVKNAERQKNLLQELAKRFPQRFIWTTTEPEYRQGMGARIFRTPADHGTETYSLFEEKGSGGQHE